MNMLFTAKALQQTYREKQVALLLAFLENANHMIHFTVKHYENKLYWKKQAVEFVSMENSQHVP